MVARLIMIMQSASISEHGADFCCTQMRSAPQSSECTDQQKRSSQATYALTSAPLVPCDAGFAGCPLDLDQLRHLCALLGA